MRAWQPLSASFEAEEKELCRCIFDACGSLGASLVTLAAALTGDFLTPLGRLLREVRQQREELLRELQRLEQQELTCSSGVQETQRRKEKVSAELKERARQPHGLSSWMKKGNKLRAAARAQTEAVEELAGRLDERLGHVGHWSRLRLDRREASEALRRLQGGLRSRRRELLEKGVLWTRGAALLPKDEGRRQETHVRKAVPKLSLEKLPQGEQERA